MDTMHRSLSHLLGSVIKILFHFALNYQSFGGLCAGNTLIKIAGNLRINFTYFTVDTYQLFLEESGSQSGQGYYCQHPQSQLVIDGQHDHHRAQNIGQIPNTVHQSPGHQGADTVGITHNSCMNVTHTILIIIRKSQCLQMIEAGTLHISSHIHFHLAGLVCRNTVGYHLKDQDTCITKYKHHQRIQRIFLNKMIQRVPLK